MLLVDEDFQKLFVIIRVLLTHSSQQELLRVSYSLIEIGDIFNIKKELTIIRNNSFLRVVFIFIISRIVMIYEINTDCWLDSSFSAKETGNSILYGRLEESKVQGNIIT